MTDEKGRTPLHNAVIDFDIDEVRTLLETGVDIEATDNDQKTALFFAALGRSQILETLIEAGADPAGSVNGERPIDAARECGCYDCVKILSSVLGVPFSLAEGETWLDQLIDLATRGGTSCAQMALLNHSFEDDDAEIALWSGYWSASRSNLQLAIQTLDPKDRETLPEGIEERLREAFREAFALGTK